MMATPAASAYCVSLACALRRRAPSFSQPATVSSIACTCEDLASPDTAVSSSGSTVVPLRSTDAAVSIAVTRLARVMVPPCAASCAAIARCSDSTRCTGPYVKLSSAAEKPGAGLLFQLVMLPVGDPISCGWPSKERKPGQSALPVPHDGRLGSTPVARIGSRPLW